MQNALPAVEGLTPFILWYTFAGIVAIGGLIVLYGKVVEVFQKHRKNREDAKAKEDGTIQGQLKETIISANPTRSSTEIIGD